MSWNWSNIGYDAWPWEDKSAGQTRLIGSLTATAATGINYISKASNDLNNLLQKGNTISTPIVLLASVVLLGFLIRRK